MNITVLDDWQNSVRTLPSFRKVAGHAVTSSSQIQSVLGNYHPGNKISISWTDQSGQSHTATVTLSAGPAH